jgi:hypothetical protein
MDGKVDRNDHGTPLEDSVRLQMKFSINNYKNINGCKDNRLDSQAYCRGAAHSSSRDMPPSTLVTVDIRRNPSSRYTA